MRAVRAASTVYARHTTALAHVDIVERSDEAVRGDDMSGLVFYRVRVRVIKRMKAYVDSRARHVCPVTYLSFDLGCLNLTRMSTTGPNPPFRACAPEPMGVETVRTAARKADAPLDDEAPILSFTRR